MAYNSNKGNQHSGDIQYEQDPTDTQIDFENDSIALKTGGQQRLVTNNTHISSSLNVSGAAFYANGTLIAGGAITTYNNASDNRVITSVDSSTVQGEANLTFNGAALSAPVITSSVGVHVSGATSRLSIGDVGDATNNGGMLFIRPTDTSNRALCLMQSKETEGNRVIFAVTGSGKVIVGGGHFGGVLSISGSDEERLISVKTDSTDPLFFLDATGDVKTSGSLTLKDTEPSIHFSSSADATARALIGLNTSNNILIQNSTTNKHIVFKANDNGTIREGFRIDGAVPEVVVNQGGDSLIDFRVESNLNTHMLFVDGAANKVGINTNAPTHELAVSGNVEVSGTLRGRELEWTRTAFGYTATNEIWIPFEGIGESNNPDWENQFIAPYNGELKRILIRPESAQNGNISASVWIGTDGVAEIDGGTRVESATGSNSGAYTTTILNFTGSNHFAAGDIVGVSIKPRLNPGKVNLTCIWQYDKKTF